MNRKYIMLRMSALETSITDQSIRFFFSRGLTQAEIAWVCLLERTENIHINGLQNFLREYDSGAVQGTCVLQGCSSANQRMESFWRIYRRQKKKKLLKRCIPGSGEFHGDFIDKGNSGKFSFSNNCFFCKRVSQGKSLACFKNIPWTVLSKDYPATIGAVELSVLTMTNTCD